LLKIDSKFDVEVRKIWWHDLCNHGTIWYNNLEVLVPIFFAARFVGFGSNF